MNEAVIGRLERAEKLIHQAREEIGFCIGLGGDTHLDNQRLVMLNTLSQGLWQALNNEKQTRKAE